MPHGNGTLKETDWNPNALAGGPKILRKEDVVFYLNDETQKKIWKCDIEAPNYPQATPIKDGQHVYALTYRGFLLFVSEKNGKLLLKRDLVSEYDLVELFYGFTGSPVIDG